MCSFGVILWEMYSKQQFFGTVTWAYQIEDLIQAGHRPPIPDNCPSDYAELIRYGNVPSLRTKRIISVGFVGRKKQTIDLHFPKL